MANNQGTFMSSVNGTGFIPSSFILVGIPGLEDFHIWLAPPLTAMYAVTLLGNCILLLAVKTVLSLHKPMYLLIALLSSSDLVLSSSILPRMLTHFWFNAREISYSACLCQMFFMHSFAAVESGLLTAMACDRYVAICNPLRYTSIITNSLVVSIGAACIARGMFIVFPQVMLILPLRFCSQHIVHSFCEQIAVAKLSCDDITLNSAYGLWLTIVVGLMDLPCIAVSYIQIIRAVLLIPHYRRFKAFSTCGAHISVMSLFYIPILFSLGMHRLHHSIPLYIHILVVNAYLLLPPVLNPLIYGVKLKEIRLGVMHMLKREKANCFICK